MRFMRLLLANTQIETRVSILPAQKRGEKSTIFDRHFEDHPIRGRTLEPIFKPADEPVECDRLVQIVKLPILYAGNIRAGRESVEPAGEHVARRDADSTRITLPAAAE